MQLDLACQICKGVNPGYVGLRQRWQFKARRKLDCRPRQHSDRIYKVGEKPCELVLMTPKIERANADTRIRLGARTYHIVKKGGVKRGERRHQPRNRSSGACRRALLAGRQAYGGFTGGASKMSERPMCDKAGRRSPSRPRTCSHSQTARLVTVNKSVPLIGFDSECVRQILPARPDPLDEA